MLAFFTSAGLWMLLQAEFLAIALVLVYVGAVMVLFLFVVMMLDINLEQLREGFWSYLPLGADGRRCCWWLEMVLVLVGRYFGLSSMPSRRRRCRPVTATPRNWAGCCIPITSIRSKWPR